MLYPKLENSMQYIPYFILAISWFLYIPAYFIDIQHRFSKTCERLQKYEIFLQQILYSIADIISKIIYTFILYQLSQSQTKEKIFVS